VVSIVARAVARLAQHRVRDDRPHVVVCGLKHIHGAHAKIEHREITVAMEHA
jgi:hypothetical protein